jgi:hypothetical protein
VDAFAVSLDAVFRSLRTSCASGERHVGDLQRNAALWLAKRCSLRESVETLGTPSTPLETELLETAPYSGAVGFLAASALITAEQLKVAAAGLKAVLARKPATPERTGYAQDSVRLLGLVLLAGAACDKDALQSLAAGLPQTSHGTGFPTSWFQHQAALRLGSTAPPFPIRGEDATAIELATMVVARTLDFEEARRTFPLADLHQVDDLLARRVCRGDVTPTADLSSMILLLGLDAALRRRFSGIQDPLSLARSLCANFVSALERWPSGDAEKAWSIEGEVDVQRLLYFQFRSVFPSTVFEDPLPKEGVRSTRPDFGIRDLRLALEAKYIRRGGEFGAAQQQIESDASAFFPGSGLYDRMLVFVYDASRSLDRHAALRARLQQLPNVADAFVVSPPDRLVMDSRTGKESGPKRRSGRSRGSA